MTIKQFLKLLRTKGFEAAKKQLLEDEEKEKAKLGILQYKRAKAMKFLYKAGKDTPIVRAPKVGDIRLRPYRNTIRVINMIHKHPKRGGIMDPREYDLMRQIRRMMSTTETPSKGYARVTARLKGGQKEENVRKRVVGGAKARAYVVRKGKQTIYEPAIDVTVFNTVSVIKERAGRAGRQFYHKEWGKIKRYGTQLERKFTIKDYAKETGVVGMRYGVTRYKEDGKREYARYQILHGNDKQRKEAMEFLTAMARMPMGPELIKDKKYFQALYGTEKFYKVSQKTNIWKQAERVLKNYGHLLDEKEKKFYQGIIKGEKDKTGIYKGEFFSMMEKSLQGSKRAEKKLKKYADLLTNLYDMYPEATAEDVAATKATSGVKGHLDQLRRQLNADSIEDIPYNLKRHKNASILQYGQVLEWFARGAKGILFNVGLRNDGDGLRRQFLESEREVKNYIDRMKFSGFSNEEIIAKFMQAFNVEPSDLPQPLKDLIRVEEFKAKNVEDDKGIGKLMEEYYKKKAE